MPSDDESDDYYRQRSRTPLSETFSHEEEHYWRRKRKSPSLRGLGNDAMSRALDQLSKSPSTRRKEGATLPRQFQQLTFAVYNDKTDPVEHDHGHTTENCRNIWNYLDQLVREGKLKHLLHHPSGHHGQTHQESQRDTALRPPVGTTSVILAVPGRTDTRPSRVLSVAQRPTEKSQSEPKRARMNFHPILCFSEEDKIGTTQPHDDALLITLRIGDYDVKRVMMDGGSGVEVMYPDLYKGLRLKPEDLMPYNSPLMSFDGKLVIPKGMIRLPI
ncbi:uncharacterized protein LOC115956447 [Quercus lobata]|uniref:uncharacterized protein LOC115956447 n=1 Tax=Quercus lobata TaxID=97700 RepID=UPI0012483C81|nr:uncharacterized protein LOC115956447 [Quercus lobata]